MLPDDHPAVLAALAQRQEVKTARENESDDEGQESTAKRRKKGCEKEPHDALVEKDSTSKWKSAHIDLAEKRTYLSFAPDIAFFFCNRLPQTKEAHSGPVEVDLTCTHLQ